MLLSPPDVETGRLALVSTYFEVSVCIDENILRLQVTINDVEVM